MAKNNFKLLEDELQTKFEPSSDAIRKNISSRKDLWTLIGDLFELYIPKIINTIIGSGAAFTDRSKDGKIVREK
jgi:hypothetical protein